LEPFASGDANQPLLYQALSKLTKDKPSLTEEYHSVNSQTNNPQANTDQLSKYIDFFYKEALHEIKQRMRDEQDGELSKC
jgi:hypothetical protein